MCCFTDLIWSREILSFYSQCYLLVLLQENIDAVFCAKLHHVLDLILQHDPPWKSTSMLGYYLDLLQCPICKKGTWNLIEMLVR